MIRNLLLIAISLLFTGLANAQTEFQRTYGGLKKENSYQVFPGANNTIFSVGSTESFGKGGSDIYLMKTDSAGNLLWAKSYGSAKDDYGTCMDKTKDGNYVLVGYTSGFTTYNGAFNDICMIKINEEGEVLWSKTYGLDRSDFATSVQCTSDGGFIIVGEAINFIGSEKNSDILIVKTNAQGVIEWSKVTGGTNTDYAYSVQELKGGGYIIGGETNSYGSGNWDFYLMKIAKDGTIIWGKSYGSKDIDYGRYAIQCPDGGFMLGGNTSGFSSQVYDFCLIKTDVDGNVQWSKTYGGDGTDYLLSMEVINDNGFVFTGYTNSQPSKSEDACIVYVDFTGKPKWAKLFGSDLHDSGVSVTLNASKSTLILGGSTNGFGTRGEDVFLVTVPLTARTLPCNNNFFYPFLSKKVEVLTKTGHYEFDLHCDELKVTMGVTTTVSAEQIICNTTVGKY